MSHQEGYHSYHLRMYIQHFTKIRSKLRELFTKFRCIPYKQFTPCHRAVDLQTLWRSMGLSSYLFQDAPATPLEFP